MIAPTARDCRANGEGRSPEPWYSRSTHTHERCKCEITTSRVKDVEFVPWGVKIDKLIKGMHIGDYVWIECVTGVILAQVFIKVDMLPEKNKEIKEKLLF